MADIKVLGTEEQTDATQVQETVQTTAVETVAVQETQTQQPLPVTPVTPVPAYAEELADDNDQEVEDANKEEDAPIFLSLEDILGKSTEELTAEAQGHFATEKIGAVPFTAISYDDYKQAKKDCVTYSQDDNGVRYVLG